MMKNKVLLVEDEIDLGSVVKQYLEMMDFDVDWHTSAESVLQQASQANIYNIMVFDVAMPGMDGFTLAEKITNPDSSIPFLFLTARKEKQDKLHGLRLGADDYITKPFDIDELVLRIKNIIRRNNAGNSNQQQSNIIQKHDVIFYKDFHKVSVAGKEIALTAREAELLEYLFKNENRILKREDILLQLWGENDFFLGRSLDVFISRLRKHLSKSAKITIKNAYGVGFIFSC